MERGSDERQEDVVKENSNLWRVIRDGRWMEGEIGRWVVRSMEGAD